jgi:hypothetical protein
MMNKASTASLSASPTTDIDSPIPPALPAALLTRGLLDAGTVPVVLGADVLVVDLVVEAAVVVAAVGAKVVVEGEAAFTTCK